MFWSGCKYLSGRCQRAIFVPLNRDEAHVVNWHEDGVRLAH